MTRLLVLGFMLGGCSLQTSGLGGGAGEAPADTGGELADGAAEPSPTTGVGNGGPAGWATGVDAGGPAATVTDLDSSLGDHEAGSQLDTAMDAMFANTGAAADTGPSQDADATQADATEAGSQGCSLDGRYAVRIDADVTWDRKTLLGFVPILRAGEGQLSVTVRVDLARDGTVMLGSTQPCSAVVPDFRAEPIAGNEDFSLYFEDAVWDAEEMAETPVRIELACAEPECAFSVDPLQVLVGAHMDDPTAAWPEDADDLTYPDHDGDTLPGVTLSARGPDTVPYDTYSYPPTGIASGRASALMMGIRVGVALEGRLDSCGTWSGTADPFALEVHAKDCTPVGGSGGGCSRAQASFMDDNVPQWTSRSAQFRAVQLEDDATCADVRAAVQGL